MSPVTKDQDSQRKLFGRKLPFGDVSPETVDRVLIGLCAIIWLAFVGMLVGAIVVMTESDDPRKSGSGSSWGIYVAIAVSVAVIAGAIPLLWRARQSASQRSPKTKSASTSRVTPRLPDPESSPPDPSTEKMRAVGDALDPVGKGTPAAYSALGGQKAHRPSAAAAARSMAIDRVWLRTSVGMTGAIGLALLAVVTGTYMLTVDKETAAIVAFALAGVVTCSMAAIPWLSLKRLQELTAGKASSGPAS